MSILLQRRWWVVALLVAAFAVRLAAGFWWQSRLPDKEPFGFADSESYWSLGRSMARGDAYEFGEDRFQVFRTPGYPVLLAGLMSVVGDDDPPLIGQVRWARALSALLGVITVGGVIWLAWLLFDERTALLAGALAAFYPGAIAMSTFVLSEAPFCPLMLAHLICWCVAWRAEDRQRQVSWGFIAGLAAGLATLVRPSWLLFTPMALIMGLTFVRGRGRQLMIGTLMLLGLVMTMTPWWVHNYHVTGRFVPTTLQVGASLYDGWNPKATGGSDMRFVDDFLLAQWTADSKRGASLEGFEVRLDRRMLDAAIAWARENPGRVCELALIKLLRMWNVWPNAADLQSWPLRVAVMIGYTPLLIFGVWGAWRFARGGWPYVLCFLPAIYFTLLHIVFVSSIRYREPAMLTLIVLAAGAISQIVRPAMKEDAVE
jgi:4-amino-4-deoxy-L-arabinose transferase-like glycosyltransferase